MWIVLLNMDHSFGDQRILLQMGSARMNPDRQVILDGLILDYVTFVDIWFLGSLSLSEGIFS
jgi:hypothetical protein